MRTIHRDIAGAFIFSKDNHLLLGKTIAGGVYQDTWVVPGGGVKYGETKLQAVTREIREEVGIDISNAHIEVIEETSTGQSEKVLRPSQERVLVDMTFYDFKVTLSEKAKDVSITLDDDLAEARWFQISELPTLNLGGATKDSLQKMGYLKCQ